MDINNIKSYLVLTNLRLVNWEKMWIYNIPNISAEIQNEIKNKLDLLINSVCVNTAYANNNNIITNIATEILDLVQSYDYTEDHSEKVRADILALTNAVLERVSNIKIYNHLLLTIELIKPNTLVLEYVTLKER